MSLTMMGLTPVPLVRMLFSFSLWRICWSCWWFRWSCSWCRVWRFCSDRNLVNWWRCSVGRVCTKRSRVQKWLTHRIIMAPKILIPPPSFKINFGTIILLWPCSAHPIRCNFTNKIARQEPVVSIDRPSDSGSGDEYGPKFIRCMDGREPHIHKVWTFGEDGVMCEVHPTAWVDVSA